MEENRQVEIDEKSKKAKNQKTEEKYRNEKKVIKNVSVMYD